MLSIDLNGDVGESYGTWSHGQDDELIPLLTSANLACGFHAGDPLTMRRTAAIALEHGVAIGAHPAYPDLVGFGRRDLEMQDRELEAAVLYQIGAAAAIVRSVGGHLTHVKPHGALYNRSARDPRVARAVARAVAAADQHLVLVGLAGSQSISEAGALGLRTIAEAFADRRYEADGRLRSRKFPGAVMSDPEEVCQQALQIVAGSIHSVDGATVAISAATICLHSDTPGAADLARQVRSALLDAGVALAAPYSA